MKNKNPKVDEWFEKYENPLKDLVAKVREIILNVDERIEEDVKWQAPTFMYKGNIASFFPKSKKNVSLMFHKGASIEDPEGLLEGEGKTSKVARFMDVEDLKSKTNALQKVIRNWISMMDKS
ncbi:MAG TPA: DUF1801 domain-containing protein [Candidatus Dojkabacteria bacterium]|jgi:hypothetical protein